MIAQQKEHIIAGFLLEQYTQNALENNTISRFNLQQNANFSAEYPFFLNHQNS